MVIDLNLEARGEILFLFFWGRVSLCSSPGRSFILLGQLRTWKSLVCTVDNTRTGYARPWVQSLPQHERIYTINTKRRSWAQRPRNVNLVPEHGGRRIRRSSHPLPHKKFEGGLGYTRHGH